MTKNGRAPNKNSLISPSLDIIPVCSLATFAVRHQRQGRTRWKSNAKPNIKHTMKKKKKFKRETEKKKKRKKEGEETGREKKRVGETWSIFRAYPSACTNEFTCYHMLIAASRTFLAPFCTPREYTRACDSGRSSHLLEYGRSSN